jgi:hypothetical protein
LETLQVNNAVDVPYSNDTRLAVALRYIVEHRQSHVGLLFRPEGEELSLFHLKFHHELVNEVPDFSYSWIPTQLDDPLITAFVEWLATLRDRNKQGLVPFSIQYCGNYFDKNGDYVQSALGSGLTCATFVLAVFADFALPLIDLATWRKVASLKDKSWQKRILDILEGHAPKEHVEKQRPLIGSAARYRPEEVGGAFGLFAGNAVTQKQVDGVSAGVLKAIQPKQAEGKGSK